MGARIEDVARAAGVSTATVSRALRGLPNVSETTRQAVSRVAADLGYVPSRTASTLASGRTLTVALVSPYMERWFFSQVIAAVESELRRSGYDALLVGLEQPYDPGRIAFEPETLRGRVDAVVVLTVPLTGRELDGVRSLGLPTVFVGASVAGAMSVRIDDVGVARTATEHLISLGHRRIGFVGGDPQQQMNFLTPSDRRAGWLAAMRAAGLDPDPRWEVVGDFTAAGGLRAGRALLALPERPTAVFAASDEMAFGVLAAARDAGVRVPEELSVIGVDGHELSELVGLTTVEQPVARQGALAAQLALAAIGARGRAVPSARPQEHVVVPVHLTERGTTCRLAGPGP
jgi:LacI family transcriptional regulator, repressor for deo operon, udp, cdd, tsx, nupC, and nupG